MNGIGTSPDVVTRIVAVPDDRLRNVMITQCYHELSRALAEARVAGGPNWCTFATWASKQAGVTIRAEDLRRSLERELTDAPEVRVALRGLAVLASGARKRIAASRIGEIVPGMIDLDAIARGAADAVGRGNRKVFAEIGFEFARYLNLPAGTEERDTAFAAFLDGLNPGDPPDGQDLLRDAFRNYESASQSGDGTRAIQRRLLANLQIGLHEQTRLQPEIAEALNAALPAIHELRRRIEREILPLLGGPLTRVGHRIRTLFGRIDPIELAVKRITDSIAARIRGVITAHFMTLEFPELGVVRLGRDLSASIPEALRALDDPELLELLRRVDPTPDSLGGTGAADWSQLDQRMHFIADLFRCHHQTGVLLSSPFSAEQLRSLLEGRLPSGRL